MTKFNKIKFITFSSQYTCPPCNGAGCSYCGGTGILSEEEFRAWQDKIESDGKDYFG